MEIDNKFGNLLNLTASMNVVAPNFASAISDTLIDAEAQTQTAFSDKWEQYQYDSADFKKFVADQKLWYLSLYGFSDEAALAVYLQNCNFILDAGAGKCYKAAWFAELNPAATVIAADISTSLWKAAEHYQHVNNLFFVQCDISSMPFFQDALFDYISCDQVIHHTPDPFRTFQELVRLTQFDKELAVYVYRKKALPRELVDDYFREFSQTLTYDELMTLSEQITDLGKKLDDLNVEMDFPDIPLLAIEGGKMSVQRFIYWNFLKCYWNAEQGHHNSVMINYDWYAPSQAFRYSEEEFKRWVKREQLEEVYFHKEEACYSGRFLKSSKRLC